jgi:hypothetical protein
MISLCLNCQNEICFNINSIFSQTKDNWKHSIHHFVIAYLKNAKETEDFYND